MLTSRWFHSLLLLPLAFVAGAARAGGDEPIEPMPDFLGLQEPRARLLILGTFHFKDAGLDDYKPKHDVDILSPERQEELAEVLERLEVFRPTAIAVEVKKARQEALDEAYQGWLGSGGELRGKELYQIGFRLGRRLGLDRLHAVDAEGRRYEPYVNRKKWAKQNGQGWIYKHNWHKRFEKMYEWEDELKTKIPLRDYLVFLNRPELLLMGHGHYLIGGFKAGNAESYPGADHLSGWWYDRNLRIFANVMQLLRSEEDRVLLVIGAGHVPILRHAAQASPEVELVEVAEVLGPATTPSP